jgi:replicative DNA helicase
MEIDQLTNGMRPGNLIIVAGRPSMGKTSFVQSILIHQYRIKNLSTVFFSLEMSEAEIMDRTMSGMARINSAQLRLRSLEVKDFSKLMEISHGEQIGELNTFCDVGGLNVQEMRSICKMHLLKLKRIDLIVVDYLQIMGIHKSAQGLNRDRQIAEISMALKNMAKEFKVPVIVLSQLNRGVESRVDKRPLLSDLRDSGSIEQDADLVAFLYRDEYYHPNSTTPGVTEFILAKNRFGRLGTVKLKWTGEYTLLENLPRVGLQVVR